jgi:hypothetical protein
MTWMLREGRAAEAITTADALRDRRPHSPDEAYVLAEACMKAVALFEQADPSAAARLLDRGLDALAEAIEGRSPRAIPNDLETLPAWAPLRRDPRFALLLARLRARLSDE